MLTKIEFQSLLQHREENADQVNQAYADATPDEQRQYLEWLEESVPAQTPPDEDSPFAALESLGSLEPTVEEIAAATLIDREVAAKMYELQQREPNPAEVAARKRAQRSNMLRSIRARFRLMEPFTISQCANRIGRDPQEVAAYLVSEIQRGSGTFTYIAEENKFFLDNPFAE